jgi:hypothetical protein
MELRLPEVLAIGFSRSRVVMMNEAHSGMQRCVRTREIGARLLPEAHAAGVRHLAMEALYGPYLAQPDMRRFIDAAEQLGWRLIPYEVNALMSTNEREEGQARNLADAMAQLPKEARGDLRHRAVLDRPDRNSRVRSGHDRCLAPARSEPDMAARGARRHRRLPRR